MIEKLNPFYGLLPHSDVSPQNPLFALEVRRVGWWQSERSPVWVGMWVCCWALALTLMVALGGAALMILTLFINGVGYALAAPGQVTANYSRLFQMVFVGSVLVAFLLDVVIVGQTLFHVVNRRDPLIGDLLHMTQLSSKTVMQAQHALARVRAWRLTVALVGCRAANVLIFWLHELFFAQREAFQVLPPYNPLHVVLEFGILMGMLLFLTLEPLWRFRMITALGVSIATRFRSIFAALVGGVMIVLVVVVVPQVAIVGNVMRFLSRLYINTTLEYVMVAAGGLMLGAGIYLSYFSLENVALRRAERYMFKEGRDDP